MINFSINKAYFLQALNTTKRAISSKNAIPILSTIKIDVTSEGITLIGSNGQISIEYFISVKDENAGLLVTRRYSLRSNFLYQCCLQSTRCRFRCERNRTKTNCIS